MTEKLSDMIWRCRPARFLQDTQTLPKSREKPRKAEIRTATIWVHLLNIRCIIQSVLSSKKAAQCDRSMHRHRPTVCCVYPLGHKWLYGCWQCLFVGPGTHHDQGPERCDNTCAQVFAREWPQECARVTVGRMWWWVPDSTRRFQYWSVIWVYVSYLSTYDVGWAM